MLTVKEIKLGIANQFIEANHRHSKKVVGHKFSLGLYDMDQLVCVLIVGRPVARLLDNGLNLEITRICALPSAPKNTISYGIGQVRKKAKTLLNKNAGKYKHLITYILEHEKGTSLKAAGFIQNGLTKARSIKAGWCNRENRDYQEIAKINKKRFITNI